MAVEFGTEGRKADIRVDARPVIPGEELEVGGRVRQEARRILRGLGFMAPARPVDMWRNNLQAFRVQFPRERPVLILMSEAAIAKADDLRGVVERAARIGPGRVYSA